MVSDEKYHDNNINKIKKAFLQNKYPKRLIEGCIKQTLEKIQKENRGENKEEENGRKNVFVPIQYINKNCLIHKKTLSQFNILPAFSKAGKNNLFTNMKNKIDKGYRKDTIYQINCLGCNQIYIGQSCTQLKDRITRHKSDIKNYPERCRLAQHTIEYKHNFDYKNTVILDTERIKKHRELLESLYIRTSQNTCNRRSDVNKIAQEYAPVLQILSDKETNRKYETLQTRDENDS